MGLINYDFQLIGKLGDRMDTPLEDQLALLDNMLEVKPELTHEILYWKARAYSHLDYYTEAKDLYLKALEHSEDKDFLAMVYESLAFVYCYFDNEDEDFYLKYLLKSLDHVLNSGNNLLRVGQFYLEREDYDNAYKYLHFLEEFEPNNPNVNSYLGKLYEQTQKNELAEQYYTKAICMSNGYPDIFQGLGRLHALKLDYTISREMFEKANKEIVSEYNFYCIGITYHEQGDMYRALHNYEEALKIDPNYFEVYNNLAKLYLEHESDVQKALRYLKKAVKLASNSNQRQLAYINLVRVNKLIVDEDARELYLGKLFEELGFITKTDEDDNE